MWGRATARVAHSCSLVKATMMSEFNNPLVRMNTILVAATNSFTRSALDWPARDGRRPQPRVDQELLCHVCPGG